jgi:hypothetical protein
MKTNLAAFLALLVVMAEVDIYGFGTSALGVLDDGALLLAGRDLLAGRSILHTVVEMEVAIELDRHLELVHGEALALVAREGCRSFFLHSVLDTLAAEGPLREGITLAEAVGARPSSLEGEVVIGVEVAGGQVSPAVATLLLVRALVVGVVGVLEAGSITVPGGSDLLGSQAGDQNSRSSEPHDGLENMISTM